MASSSSTPSTTTRHPSWADNTVEQNERDTVTARIVPAASPAEPCKYPDFATIRRDFFGDRVPPEADLLIEERERSRY
jgi:hypothetical protein